MLWGESWDSTSINSSTFGFAISCLLQFVGGPKGYSSRPTIYYIRITVYYTEGSTTSIGSINRLTKTSVKEVNSLAIASVKNWNGLE